MQSVEKQIIMEKLISIDEKYMVENLVDATVDEQRLQVLLNGVQGSIPYLKQDEHSVSFREIKSRNKFFVFVKKLLRKMMFFYVEPVCEHQSQYNYATTYCIESLLECNKLLKEELEKSNERNKILESKIVGLDEEIKEIIQQS